MYRVVYTKQATKDAKNLKSCGLDKKAKKLIEIMKKIYFRILLLMKSWLATYRDFAHAG